MAVNGEGGAPPGGAALGSPPSAQLRPHCMRRIAHAWWRAHPIARREQPQGWPAGGATPRRLSSLCGEISGDSAGAEVTSGGAPKSTSAEGDEGGAQGRGQGGGGEGRKGNRAGQGGCAFTPSEGPPKAANAVGRGSAQQRSAAAAAWGGGGGGRPHRCELAPASLLGRAPLKSRRNGRTPPAVCSGPLAGIARRKGVSGGWVLGGDSAPLPQPPPTSGEFREFRHLYFASAELHSLPSKMVL